MKFLPTQTIDTSWVLFTSLDSGVHTAERIRSSYRKFGTVSWDCLITWMNWNTMRHSEGWNDGHKRREGTVLTWLKCLRWYEASRQFHWTHTFALLQKLVLEVTVTNWQKCTVDVMRDCTSSLFELWIVGMTCHRKQLKSQLLTFSRVTWTGYDTTRWISLWTHSLRNPTAAWSVTICLQEDVQSMTQWCSCTRWDTRWEIYRSERSRRQIICTRLKAVREYVYRACTDIYWPFCFHNNNGWNKSHSLYHLQCLSRCDSAVEVCFPCILRSSHLQSQ